MNTFPNWLKCTTPQNAVSKNARALWCKQTLHEWEAQGETSVCAENEDQGPRKVRPIKMFGPNILRGFPTCLSTYVFAYLCTPRQDTSSACSRTLCRQSENGRQTSTTWLILYYKVFSPVNDTWCIVVMFCLVVWSVCVYAFRGCGFRWWFAGRVGRTLSVLSG